MLYLKNAWRWRKRWMLVTFGASWGVVVSLEKPDLPSVVLTVPTPTPTMSPSDFPYSYGATAEAAGKVRARGSKGSGRGLRRSIESAKSA